MSLQDQLKLSLTKKVRTVQDLAESDPDLISYPTRFLTDQDQLLETEILTQLEQLQGFDPNSLYDIFRLYEGITAFDFAMMLKVLLQEYSDQEALKIINGFGKISGETAVINLNNPDQLEDQFQIWRAQLARELETEINDADRLDQIIELLVQTPLTSRAKVSKFRIRALMLWDDLVINTDKGPELLDQLRISTEIPFAVYTPIDSSFKPIYKVFTDPSTEKIFDYHLITQNPADPNLLLLTVWTGNDTARITADSIQFVQIDFFRGTLTLLTDLPSDKAEQNLLNRLTAAFPDNVKLVNIEKTLMSANLDLYDLEFDMPTFLGLVGTSEVYSLLVSFREQANKPYGLRSKMSFDYHETRNRTIRRGGYIKETSDLKFSLEPRFAEASEQVETRDGRSLSLEAGTPILGIKITKARDQKTLERFLQIFPRLMAFYNTPEEIQAVRQEYTDIFGGVYTQLIPKPQPQQKTSKPNDPTKKLEKLDVLKQGAPNMFQSGYARQCNRPRQPYLISRQRANEIREQGATFTMAGQEIEVQVLEFPPDLPEFEGQDPQFFICVQPGDNVGAKDYPYPGLIRVKKSLPIHKQFPVLPCCFQNDQRLENNPYTQVYIEGNLNDDSRGSGRGNNIIKTNKILHPDGLGLINPTISTVLQWVNPQGAFDFKRLGVPQKADETNALIHCVLRAIEDPYYISLPDQPSKFDYVRRFRAQVLPRFIEPALLKQELWNFNDQEILSLLTDNQVFFDSRIFIRALEEAFQVNLYVFREWSVSKTQGKTQRVELEIPQSRLAHLSSPKARQCILVLRHRGGESDGLLRDHYELIAEVQTGDNLITLYQNQMNSLMQALTRMNSINLEWSFVGETLRVQDAYGKFDPVKTFNISDQFQITGQIIDSYGKLRGVAIGNMKVFFLPSQPLNVPEVSPETNQPPKAQTVVEIFGQPSAYNSENRLMVGLWFPLLDLEQGLYVPVQAQEPFPNLTRGNPHPLIASGENQTERIQKLKDTATMLRKIFLALYLLYPGSYSLDRKQRRNNVQAFIRDYTRVEASSERDTAEIYQFDRVPNRLNGNLDQALKQLEQSVPSLVRGGKVYLFSEMFSKEIQFMLEQQGPAPQNMILKIPYTKESDFKSMLFTRIIFGTDHYQEWLETLKDTEQVIRKTLALEDRNDLTPIPVLTVDSPEQQIFLLQNPSDHTLQSSFGIAHIWRTELINPGPEPEEIFENYPHVVYSLDPSGNLIPVADNTQGDPNFIDVIHWGGEFYGALLPLAN